MIEKIKEIISDQLIVDDINSINENTRIIEDLGADSLDVLEIVSTVEDEFGIEIDKSKLSKIHTINDIQKAIKEAKND